MSHFEITVRDLDRSLGFYRDQLGLPVVLEGTSDQVFPSTGRLRIYEHAERVFRFAVVAASAQPEPMGHGAAPTVVLLSPLGDPPTGASIKVDQVGITHFGIWVDDLDTLYERLEGEGVPCLEPPHTLLTTPEGIWRSAFLQDPDGVIVQLDEFVPPS